MAGVTNATPYDRDVQAWLTEQAAFGPPCAPPL